MLKVRGDSMFENQVIFITGGTGSLGQYLTKKLLTEKIKEIRIFSRNEALQVEMERDINDERVKFIIGDICDEKRLIETMKGSDYVFHLAALKHVPICEMQPEEAININIMGTMKVIHASIINKVKKVVAMSSDKAVNPCNVYGMTKALEEKLIVIANKISDITKFACVRSGNLMGSNGSVIPLFIEQLKEGKDISITDKNMTRYFVTSDETVQLLLDVAKISHGGEIFFMNMSSLNILKLVEVLHKYYGDKPLKIKYMGIRPGEKLNEEIISIDEQPNTFKLNDKYYIVVPDIIKDCLYDKYCNYSKVDFSNTSSKYNQLENNEIENKLAEAKIIDRGII